MRVLHVTNALPSPDFPGYGVFIEEQIKSLQNPDLQDILFINGRKYGKIAYLLGFFQLLLKARKYDVVHCHHIYTGFLAALAIPGKPKVISFLSDEFNLSTSGFKKWLYQFTVRHSQARIFKKAVPPNLLNDANTLYLPNGVDLDFFQPEPKAQACQQLNLDPTFRYILFVSSNDLHRPEKRYTLFRESLQILQQNPVCQDVRALCLVKATREHVPHYFNAAEIHVLTSLYEGSPNSVKESMACNVKVASTPVGNVRDLLEGSSSCRILESEKPEDIAIILAEMLSHPQKEDLRSLLIQKNLDMKSVAHKLTRLYQSIYPAKS
jgi:teichuronic acid biosynthesis glycosyltransferase TuaC